MVMQGRMAAYLVVHLGLRMWWAAWERHAIYVLQLRLCLHGALPSVWLRAAAAHVERGQGSPSDSLNFFTATCTDAMVQVIECAVPDSMARRCAGACDGETFGSARPGHSRFHQSPCSCT